jgi:hypothetical protein
MSILTLKKGRWMKKTKKKRCEAPNVVRDFNSKEQKDTKNGKTNTKHTRKLRLYAT